MYFSKITSDISTNNLEIKYHPEGLMVEFMGDNWWIDGKYLEIVNDGLSFGYGIEQSVVGAIEIIRHENTPIDTFNTDTFIIDLFEDGAFIDTVDPLKSDHWFSMQEVNQATDLINHGFDLDSAILQIIGQFNEIQY